jgi:hypothetical protein
MVSNTPRDHLVSSIGRISEDDGSQVERILSPVQKLINLACQRYDLQAMWQVGETDLSRLTTAHQVRFSSSAASLRAKLL